MPEMIKIGSRVTWFSDPDFWGSVIDLMPIPDDPSRIRVQWDGSETTHVVERDRITFRHNMAVKREPLPPPTKGSEIEFTSRGRRYCVRLLTDARVSAASTGTPYFVFMAYRIRRDSRASFGNSHAYVIRAADIRPLPAKDTK